MKLRPIVDQTNSYSSKAAAFLSEYLKPLQDQEYMLYDTLKFPELLHKLPPKGVDEEDVSYDVEALFTNVSIEVTIDYIIDDIYEKDVLKPLCKIVETFYLGRHIFGQRETHTSNRWLSYRRQIFYDNGKYLYDKMLNDHVLSLFRPMTKSIFGVHDPVGLRYLFQLRVILSPLRSHKSPHNFIDTHSDICQCNQGVKDTSHFLFFCPLYISQRTTLKTSINEILLQYNLTHLEDQLHCIYTDMFPLIMLATERLLSQQ